MTVENQTEKQEIVTQEGGQLATAASSAYIKNLLEDLKNDFLRVNDGMDLDFVNMGTWLHINAKGNFEELNNPNVSFGDTLDVVFGHGEQRWSCWGKEDTPESGVLIACHTDEATARQQMEEWLQNNPERAVDYSVDDVILRYMTFLVPIQSIQESAKNGDMPAIYLYSFSNTSTFSFGKFAFDIYQGKYKTMGIKARTAINQVIVRLTTSSKTKGSRSWIGVDCAPMGLFDPRDFGVGATGSPEAE